MEIKEYLDNLSPISRELLGDSIYQPKQEIVDRLITEFKSMISPENNPSIYNVDNEMLIIKFVYGVDCKFLPKVDLLGKTYIQLDISNHNRIALFEVLSYHEGIGPGMVNHMSSMLLGSSPDVFLKMKTLTIHQIIDVRDDVLNAIADLTGYSVCSVSQRFEERVLSEAETKERTSSPSYSPFTQQRDKTFYNYGEILMRKQPS